MTHPKDGGMYTKLEEEKIFKDFSFYAYLLYYLMAKVLWLTIV